MLLFPPKPFPYSVIYGPVTDVSYFLRELGEKKCDKIKRLKNTWRVKNLLATTLSVLLVDEAGAASEISLSGEMSLRRDYCRW